MAAIRSRDTKPEIAMRLSLFAAGVRGWRCDYRGAPGRPDIAWPTLRVAVFVDGAFWHGHSSRFRPGRSGTYWDEKIAANVARDRRVNAELKALGWEVLRFWDFEVSKETADTVETVKAVLRERLRRQPDAEARWQRQLLDGG